MTSPLSTPETIDCVIRYCADHERVPVVAYGYENTRPTEGAALLMVKLDNSTDQYPELATKLVRQSDHLAALDAERAKVPQWVSVHEGLPEPDEDVLVWSQQPWENEPSAKIDRWTMQWESPVSWSSVTVETGYGWGEHDDFQSVTHWQRILPPAPAPQGDDQ